MQILNQPAIKAVTDRKPNAHEHVFIFESVTEFVTKAKEFLSSGLMNNRSQPLEWLGDKDTRQTLEAVENGDPTLAGRSTEDVDRLERFLHVETRRFKTVDDVAGGCPNIPAYLAGQPLAMRRRQRIPDEQAPLTVIIEATSSASISHSDLEKRGAVCLAFMRLMAMRRPVKLFVSVCGGYSLSKYQSDASRLLIPVETAPLDVTRAAYLLCGQGLPRAVCYQMAYALLGSQYDGSGLWPYDDNALSRTTEQATYAAIFGGEVFNITGAYGTDKNIKNPALWLEETLTKFGMTAEKAA